jgi:hypothetical protein
MLAFIKCAIPEYIFVKHTNFLKEYEGEKKGHLPQ